MADKKQEVMSIPAPNIKQVKVAISGLSPLIFHKWDEKAIRMMLDKQMKKAAKGREARDPDAEYENSYYYDEQDDVAFPARNLKQAIVGSARFLSDVKMTILRGTIFVWGSADKAQHNENNFIKVLHQGKPISRQMVKDNMEMWKRQDMVTVGMGSADIRFRGQIPEWTMEFFIEFDADMLSLEQVLNLLARAGFSQGIGEWRPEKNGDNGTFQVTSTSGEDK